MIADILPYLDSIKGTLVFALFLLSANLASMIWFIIRIESIHDELLKIRKLFKKKSGDDK